MVDDEEGGGEKVSWYFDGSVNMEAGLVAGLTGELAVGVSACSAVDVVRWGCAVELHGIGYLLWTP